MKPALIPFSHSSCPNLHNISKILGTKKDNSGSKDTVEIFEDKPLQLKVQALKMLAHINGEGSCRVSSTIVLVFDIPVKMRLALVTMVTMVTSGVLFLPQKCVGFYYLFLLIFNSNTREDYE